MIDSDVMMNIIKSIMKLKWVHLNGWMNELVIGKWNGKMDACINTMKQIVSLTQ
jgi:hypothetical protein